MNPTYEIGKKEALPLLQEIRDKLIESGYKCRKFTNSNDGFCAKHGQNWCRVFLKYQGEKVGITWVFSCKPNDHLHKIGIAYMIESIIVNFRQA